MKTPLEKYMRDCIRKKNIEEIKIILSMLPESRKEKYRLIWQDEVKRINSGLPSPEVPLLDRDNDLTPANSGDVLSTWKHD